MKRSEVSALATQILGANMLVDQRLLRAALRQAADQIKIEVVTDEAIKAAFVPGQAFNVKSVASGFGCTPARVSALAKAAGLVKLGPGVYQA